MWLVFLVLAIINGGARNSLYAPKVGEHKGHIISSLIAICYTLAGTYLFVNATAAIVTQTDLLLIGGLWLAITIVFEFGFGHYIIKHPWSHLLADYNLLKGRLWSLVLLTTFVSPAFWGLLVLG
jgi:hypothetical protein